MEWTRDAIGLVFVGTRAKEAFSTRRDQVYYLSLETGEAKRITTDGNRYDVESLGVTDRDEILAVPFNRMSQIWSMDAGGDARTSIQITTGFADGRGGIAPLADGRVAFLTRHGDGFSVWMMNSDGSNRKQLTTDPPNIEEVRASIDGRFLVFSAKDQQASSHLYRINSDGGDLMQLTFGDSHEVDSSISPDGDSIVFDSERFVDGSFNSGLLRIPSGGGEPIDFTRSDCESPHYSPDGKFISCVSADWKTVSILSAETGETLTTFKTEADCVLNIGVRWSPDSAALVYIVSRNGVSNLIRQPVDGTRPAPLTDFTSGEIHNFAFSIDGSRLYLARGYSTRNAVLISNFR
jgi:Tol biopolymer transport system component